MENECIIMQYWNNAGKLRAIFPAPLTFGEIAFCPPFWHVFGRGRLQNEKGALRIRKDIL